MSFFTALSTVLFLRFRTSVSIDTGGGSDRARSRKLARRGTGVESGLRVTPLVRCRSFFPHCKLIYSTLGTLDSIIGVRVELVERNIRRIEASFEENVDFQPKKRVGRLLQSHLS
jgi:hypothetical protein